MSRTNRRILLVAGAISALLVLLLAAALYTLQTAWFKAKVRERIIASVEAASGGRVELGSFDYDRRTLTAEFRVFILHGTEPASAPPLFKAERLRVGLKIISIFKHDIDVASVVVLRPEIHLFIAPDGSTNVPAPRLRHPSISDAVEALLNFKVRHFEIDNGLVEADLHRIPLSVTGENTSVVLAYNGRGRRYDVRFSSHELRVNSDPLRPFSGTLEANARIERDSLSVQNTVFHSGQSTVQASGTIHHFAHPVADWRLAAELEASDLASVTKFEDIGHGKLTLKGAAHYDENTPFVFQGKIAGRDVAYRIKSVDLRKITFESDLLAHPHDLEFSHFVLQALGSKVSGHMSFRHGTELQLEGALSGLSVQEAGSLFAKQNLPWSGVLAGPFHLRASLDRGGRDLILQSHFKIVPGSGDAPVSGDLDSTYRASGNVLEFASSSVSFLNTRIQFLGTWGANLDVSFDSTNLADLNPLRRLTKPAFDRPVLPALLPNGSAHFDGRISGHLDNPQFAGNIALADFELQNERWNQLRSRLVASESAVEFSSLVLDQGALHATADGRVALQKWTLTSSSAVQLRAQFRGADVVRLANSFLAVKLPLVRGIASGTLDLKGTVVSPQGVAEINFANVDAYGERLNRVQLAATFAADTVQITRGLMQAGPAELSFSGAYRRGAASWREGQVQLKVDSNGFPLASLAPVHEYQPGLNAQFEIHGQGAARIARDRIEPLSADGVAILRNVTLHGVPYGSINFSAGTRAQSLTTSFSGNLRGSRVTGSAQVQMTTGNPAIGQVHLDQIQLSTIAALIQPTQAKLPFEGLVQGGFTFEGPLQQIDKMHGTIGIERLQFTTPSLSATGSEAPAGELTFRNVSPVVLQYANGLAAVSRFQMTGNGSTITLSGSVPLVQARPLSLKLNGSLDLHVFQLFNRDVRATGESLVAASIGGTIANPEVNGTLHVKNGTLFANNFPNGLTAVNGTIRFERDRATIETLTAQTGGGALSIGGFTSFGHGAPLIYHLEANAENVRVRYANSVSVTATSNLRLSGTSRNSILSGTATVSRVIFNPNTDLGNLLASAAAPSASPGNEKDFLTGLQFDIHVESAPNLQVNTELSRDVEAEIDLRLRGTPERPILLGNITANQGAVNVFGAKYTINRGEINFVNTVKIEPVLDLDLQTQARGITVDITVSGTAGKLNINYRSDPPLQPRDIIALLTVGHTPSLTSNVPNISVTNDVSALQSGANTVLGQAISPASNRLSKLFGITNIKIDPMVQGITNAPQARLTVEEQVSRQITVTYVTNLSQTSEQVFRLEWAFSTQYSVVALRDDNGEFGIDLQYRKRFK